MNPTLVADDEVDSSPSGTETADEEPPLPEALSTLLPSGSYRIESFLAQGGMGAVYKGIQLRLHRPVAIKIMRRDQGQDFGFEQRFQREALAMATLNHPNIVSVIDYGEAGPDYLYIVMELIEGADLMEVIRTGHMTQEMALSLLPQICDALQFAHDHGIIHRDIKPSNIMLTRDGRIKIADFGLAKRHEVESGFLTRSGTGMGTPAYAAPEQLIAEGEIDHRADIYALGVMIYQMITGELPRGLWKPPSQKTACDPHWDEIVSQAMQSDPRDRYQQASEVKIDLSSIGISVAEPRGSVSEPVTRNSTKSRAPFVVGLVAGCVVISAGGVLALKNFGVPGQGVQPARDVPIADLHTFGGHRYQFVPGAMRWDEARAKSAEMGGHLATVTSKSENEWVYNTFSSRLDPNLSVSSIWLGGFSEASGGPWKWVTGEPFDFTAWNRGEPDYVTLAGEPAEGPHGIVIKKRERHSWHDYPAFRMRSSAGFVVEWDDPGVVTSPTLSVSKPIDLLALVDVVQDVEGGTWRREGTDLIADERQGRREGLGTRLSLALPVRVKGSYRIEVEFAKNGRKETIGVLLPLADDRSVVANFQESADYAGLVTVRGLDLKDSDNPTRVFNALENERRYRAAIEVRLNGDQVDIAATFEGEPLFRFQGPVADLDSQRYALKDQARPGLKSMDPVTWHGVWITALDGGTLTPAREGVTLPAAGVAGE